jgi:hypothetical protein
MDESRRRLQHLRADARLSLTVLAAEEWYRHVTLEGRAVAIERDADLAGIDRLARHYTGSPFQTRDRTRFNAWIEVDAWHAWAGAHAWTGGFEPA